MPYVSTFRAPSEYEMEMQRARRQQALAEALAQQMYQPTEGGAAPIPSAAPLVRALQSFMAGRAERKATEALERAKTADVAAAKELLQSLLPQERSGAEEAIAEMQKTAVPGQLSKDGTYTPSQITPSTAPIGMPYTQAAPVGEARKDILQGAMVSGTPTSKQLAQALMSQKPAEFDIKETGMGLMRIDKTTAAAQPITYGGEILMPRDAYSMGMTPAQKAQYEIDLAKSGVEIANANLARNKAADEGVDVSGVNIPRTIGGSRAAPQVAPPEVRVPSVTPAQMRMGVESAPVTARSPRTPEITAVSATIPAETKVPLIRSNLISSKQKRDLALAEPQARIAAKNAMTEGTSIINIARDLARHPGLANITGVLGQQKITDLAPEAREARELYEALAFKVSLLRNQMARDASKTGGAFGNMTEAEWPRLEKSFGAIGLSQDPDGFRRNIANFESELNAMLGNNQEIYSSTYGKLDWKPQEYKPISDKYVKKDQKPAGTSSRGRWGRATVIPQ